MKRLTIGLFAAASLASLLSVHAKTVTWIGGATTSGNWNKPANWDAGDVPTTGDVAVFNDAVTLTDKIDLGAGLTISNTATVRIGTAMKGAGDLVKSGTGTVNFAALTYGEFKGGVQVKEGQFTVLMSGKTGWGQALSGKDSQTMLGAGTVTVSDSGVLRVYGNSATFNNSVVIANHVAGKALSVGGTNSVEWTGGVVSDGDFAWEVEYYTGTITLGKISAPGKTVSLTSARSEWNTVFLNDEVDANLIVDTAQLCVQLKGVSRNPCNTLTFRSKRLLEMAGDAVWGGRLVIENTGAKVDLLGSGNLQPTSFVSIDDGGAGDKVRLNIDKYDYTIRGFAYNGAITASGDVSTANVGSAISGLKKMTVDSSIKMWTGRATGQWGAAANWETKEAPASGDTAIIPNDVAFAAETVDIGEGGLTADCYGAVAGPLILSGSGKFVKRGAKAWTTGGKYLLTGGVRIEAGQLVEKMTGEGLNYMTDGLGTGTIEITGSGCWYPQAYCATNTQPVVIYGHDATHPIRTSGSFVNLGTVTADADFTIYSQWEWPCFKGAIHAPGKTVTYLTSDWNKPEWTPFDAEFADVNANLVVNSPTKKVVRLSGMADRRDCGLTVNAGKVACPSSQGWGALTFAKNTSVEIPKGIVLRGESLALGGTSLVRGRYTSTKLARMGMDGYVDGEGKIQVGNLYGGVMSIR